MVFEQDTPGDGWRRRSQFRSLNRWLEPERGSHRCRGLWDLLTPHHREDPGCCIRGSWDLDLGDCFLGRLERWQDSRTGLPVAVGHPDCWHVEDDHHAPFQAFFAERGLDYRVCRGGWLEDSPTLVVVARADVIEGVEMPPGLEGLEPVHHPGWLTPDWEVAEARRLAEERVLRDRKARLAQDEEERGDHETALALYCEVAHMDRTGEFHNLARDQLVRAKAVVDACPGLDLSRLYFKNARDRDRVCGAVPPVLSRAELRRGLEGIELPRGWSRFRSLRGGHALARITDLSPTGEERRGTVSLEQGGTMNYWLVSIEVDGAGRVSPSPRDEPGSYSGPADYCWPDPESAVGAAVEAWRDFQV